MPHTFHFLFFLVVSRLFLCGFLARTRALKCSLAGARFPILRLNSFAWLYCLMIRQNKDNKKCEMDAHHPSEMPGDAASSAPRTGLDSAYTHQAPLKNKKPPAGKIHPINRTLRFGGESSVRPGTRGRGGESVSVKRSDLRSCFRI